MRVLITGAHGFIGKNLQMHFQECSKVDAIAYTRESTAESLPRLLEQVDFIYHLAGINRPDDPNDFVTGNVDFTKWLCDAAMATGRSIPILYASSIQATEDTPYGRSKLAAESRLIEYSKASGSPVRIVRLPNVFGKWAKPNYNSVVATFCYNIARNLPIHISNPDAKINLAYIDDVVASFVTQLNTTENPADGNVIFESVEPTYQITLGRLAEQLRRFKTSRENLITEPVGSGLTRALYSTYVSYFAPEHFTYHVPLHCDDRGVFVEMIKTQESGQVSYFTARPGITRGGHYHHSKSEKFLVIQGEACFRFLDIITGETIELTTTGKEPQIVETIPGWAHDITNIGDSDLICMLWANEVFDPKNPDTFAQALQTK